MTRAVVSGSFDDLRCSDIRFLEEAARTGQVHVFLWSDALVRQLEGRFPIFPLDERMYLLRAIRHVSKVHPIDHLPDPDSLPDVEDRNPATWVIRETHDNQSKHNFCSSNGLRWQVVRQNDLLMIPPSVSFSPNGRNGQKKVVVTGCYDWFHSGHVRFFEEVSGYGDLYVAVGSDENVRFLKGDGHPMFPAAERRYVVQSIRHVRQALISTGSGWMDAEPEIHAIKPDIYVVNEDGDRPEKRSFCESHGIQYLVLKRTPREGLPRRVSTDLRGY